MRELLAFFGLSVPIKYVDQFGMEGVYFKPKFILGCWNLKENITIHRIYNVI